MAKKKIDAVLESVRLEEDGQLQWARIYERRGIIFTDHFLVDREQLVQRLKSGKKIFTGKRQPKMGSVFDTFDEIRLTTSDGKELMVAGSLSNEKDFLTSLPRF